MKYLFTACLLCSTTVISLAQSTFPTDGSNVGIGLTSPSSRLEIFSASDSRPAGNSAQPISILKMLRAGTSNYSYNESAEFRLGHGGPSVWGSRLDLFINGGSNNNNIPDQHAMTWLYNGNVGIGTTNPNYKVEIAGGTGGRGIMGNLSTGQYYELIPYETGTHDNAGVAGTILGVRTGGFNGSSKPISQNITANNAAYQQAWAMTFGTDKNQTDGAAFSVWTGDATIPGTPMDELFRIRSNGNVLIGKISQINTSYKLDVAGIIRSNRVIVNTTGADFVFKPNYNLRPLAKVNDYIKANHHLPDVPSAAQMQNDGMDVGELNKLLLQKVEELTLYLIEKDKSDRELRKELDSLKKQIAAQRNSSSVKKK